MRERSIWHWIKRTAEASFVPCVAVATTLISIVLGVYYVVAFLLTFGLYVAGVAILLLILRLGGWKVQWREWLASKW